MLGKVVGSLEKGNTITVVGVGVPHPTVRVFQKAFGFGVAQPLSDSAPMVSTPPLVLGSFACSRPQPVIVAG